MKRGTWERHCSTCAAYTVSTKAGIGMCGQWRKAVAWSLVCDHWKERG